MREFEQAIVPESLNVFGGGAVPFINLFILQLSTDMMKTKFRLLIPLAFSRYTQHTRFQCLWRIDI